MPVENLQLAGQQPDSGSAELRSFPGTQGLKQLLRRSFPERINLTALTGTVIKIYLFLGCVVFFFLKILFIYS